MVSGPRSLATRVLGYAGPDVGRADLWWAELADLREEHGGILNPVEEKRAASYVRAADRDRFTLGVVLSRRVLGAMLSVAPADVPLDRACEDCERPHGRPRLSDQAAGAQATGDQAVDFSISHSGRRLVLLVARGVRVGVDIEEVVMAADLPSVARGVFTPAELVDSQGASGEFDSLRFFTQWVAKESALKALGVGLRMPMNEVGVVPLAHSSGPVTFVSEPTTQATTQRLAAPAGYVAAATVLLDAPLEIRVR